MPSVPKIRVVVRKRPLTQKEHSDEDVLDVISSREIQVREMKEKLDLTKYCEVHKYFFDNCFAQDDDNFTVSGTLNPDIRPVRATAYRGALRSLKHDLLRLRADWVGKDFHDDGDGRRCHPGHVSAGGEGHYLEAVAVPRAIPDGVFLRNIRPEAAGLARQQKRSQVSRRPQLKNPRQKSAQDRSRQRPNHHERHWSRPRNQE